LPGQFVNEIAPGGYAHCRRGVWVDSTNPSLLGSQILNFNGFVVGPAVWPSQWTEPVLNGFMDNPHPGGLFLVEDSPLSRIGFGPYSGRDLNNREAWNWQKAGVPNARTELPSDGQVEVDSEWNGAYRDLSLYRYYNMTDANLPGITNETTRYVILIHGWNPGAQTDIYYDPDKPGLGSWDAMEANLTRFFSTNHVTSWKVLKYHMESDTATGGLDPLSTGNSAEAAEGARLHGYHMAQMILAKCPNIEYVHLIAHSAGTWAARSCFQYLTSANSPAHVRVQMTILDGFVPAQSTISGETNLGIPEINSVIGSPCQTNKIFGMDNYFAEQDFNVQLGVYIPDPAVGTQNSFSWGIHELVGDVGIDSYSVRRWTGHGGPIYYYADSVTNPENWGGTCYAGGWPLSMAYKDTLGGGLPGTLFTGGVGGRVDWYWLDDTFTVTCVPFAGWQFVEWTGDVPSGMATNNPLTFAADRSRSIMAKCSLPSTMKMAFPGYGRTETLTNFPLLVVLNSGISGFQYDHFASTNGWDLRFTEVGQTSELAYEIERWDTQGTSYVWVRVPALTSHTEIQALWGNPSQATRPAYTTNGTVWAADYSLVMHMMQSAADSSTNRLGGTEANMLYTNDGGIGASAFFNYTTTPKIEKVHSPVLEPGSRLTISAWINPFDLNTSNYREIYRKEDGDARQLLSFQGNGTYLSFGLGIGTAYSELDVPISYSDYNYGWHLVTATYDGSVQRLYKDGVQIGSKTISGTINQNGTSSAFVGSWAGTSEYFYGYIDELRFSNTSRSCSSNWVWACYMNQKAGSTFSSYAAVQNLFSFRVVSPYGTPSPVVGTHSNGLGATVAGSVVSPDTRGTTQYVCTGWSMTGNVPLSGATNVMSMTLTNNAVLTWLWATNVMFAGAAGPNGSVSGAANGWYPVGNSVTVTAAAAQHYHFASWSGDVPVADTNRNPLNVTMDRARSLTASFVANLSLNNTPNWWLAQHGLSTNATGAVHDDGDGVPAWAEWEADTDPTNSVSVFKLTDLTLASGRRIFFQSSSNRLYTLEYRTNLSGGVWIPLSGQTDVLGGGGGAYLQDTNATPARFYRVRVRKRP
jgi:hypothetical protein